MKILVTGGTVFVSRCVAEYFVGRNHDVSVLNRGTRPQTDGVRLIKADRRDLKGRLSRMEFDAVIDVTSYTARDIVELRHSGVVCSEYVLISSGAVYPEYGKQPFDETETLAANSVWGNYGIHKIAAEAALAEWKPDAYVLRPSYLYGPYNRLYREAFVFDCARNHRKFCLPGHDDLGLQFFYIGDLCRFLEIVLAQKPGQKIFNVGNAETISIREWVGLCYQAAGETAEYVQAARDIPQTEYFPFPDYGHRLDVSRMREWMGDVKDMREGLRLSYEWYRGHSDEVGKKEYMRFIDEKLLNRDKMT